MRTVNAKCGAVIPIGRLGENEATAVVFDVAEWIELFGVGDFTLLHQRSGDPAPYPCSIEHDENTVTWTVTSADLGVQGYGKCELIYTVSDTVAKSVIYTTVTGAALTGGAEPPEPWEDWVQRVLAAGQRVDDFLETLEGGETGQVWTKDGDTAHWADPQGGGGDKTFVFRQQSASAQWSITHDLDKYPSVTVVDSAGTVVTGDVTYEDNSNLTVAFSAPFSGTAYLN